MQKSEPEEQQDLDWLLRSRSENQALLLSLYKITEEEVGRLQADAESSYQLLVGAAFSLWRAAFLVYEGRTPEATLKNARKFLHLLVRDNAINYPQDRSTHAWTVGYYINNALFRLHRAARTLWTSENRPPSYGPVAAFLDRDPAESVPEAKELWTSAHTLALDIRDAILAAVQAAPPPPSTAPPGAT